MIGEPRGAAWAPLPSSAVAQGVALSVAALVLTVVASGLVIGATDLATRLLAAALSVAWSLILAVSVAGVWQCATLAYLLGPSALEIRSGWRRIRVRYGEIERVGPASEDQLSAPTLWPGAHLGCPSAAEPAVAWFASTRNRSGLVVVEAERRTWVLSPSEPAALSDALIRCARDTPFQRTGDVSDCTWVDRVSGADWWSRVLLVCALAAATIGLTFDVARFGSAQSSGLAAGVAVGLNSLLGFSVLRGEPVLARMLLVVALSVQIAALRNVAPGP
ncbi:MAG: hypothetical protein HW416_1410 [Chloroflexi bacterium]|nr:hypothetical protein [Chloroflexota bacterium]